jgi:hypothetical protein
VAGGNTAQASAPKKADHTEDAAIAGPLLDTITLNEGLQILADYVRLTKRNAGTQPPQ